MKIYVGGKFEEKDRARVLMAKLREELHTITHDWTREDDTIVPEDQMKAYWQKCAVNDMEGVLNADVVIILNHVNLYGGMVELGLALGERIPVIVFDHNVRNTVFWHLPGVVKMTSIHRMLEYLQQLESGEVPWPKVG